MPVNEGSGAGDSGGDEDDVRDDAEGRHNGDVAARDALTNDEGVLRANGRDQG